MHSDLFQDLCSFNIGFNEGENSLLPPFGNVADQDLSVAGVSSDRCMEQEVSQVPVEQSHCQLCQLCRATAVHLGTAPRASAINCWALSWGRKSMKRR